MIPSSPEQQLTEKGLASLALRTRQYRNALVASGEISELKSLESSPFASGSPRYLLVLYCLIRVGHDLAAAGPFRGATHIQLSLVLLQLKARTFNSNYSRIVRPNSHYLNRRP